MRFSHYVLAVAIILSTGVTAKAEQPEAPVCRSATKAQAQTRTLTGYHTRQSSGTLTKLQTSVDSDQRLLRELLEQNSRDEAPRKVSLTKVEATFSVE